MKITIENGIVTFRYSILVITHHDVHIRNVIRMSSHVLIPSSDQIIIIQTRIRRDFMLDVINAKIKLNRDAVIEPLLN